MNIHQDCLNITENLFVPHPQNTNTIASQHAVSFCIFERSALMDRPVNFHGKPRSRTVKV